MSKDVIIAGSVAVCCIALIAVAVIAPKGHSEPSEPPKVDISPADGTQPVDPLAPAPGGALAGDHPLAPTTPGLPPLGSTTAPAVQPGLPGGLPPAGPISAAPFPPVGTGTPGGGLSTTLPAPAPIVAEPAPAPAKEAKTHTVAKDELLGDIAHQYYGKSKEWRRIVAANPGLDPNHMKVGQKLVIPTLETAPANAGTTATGGDRTYTVKKGEGYHAIAAKVLKDSKRWKELEKLNGTPSSELKVGQVIKLPAAPTDAAPNTTGDAPAAPGTKTHTVANGEHLADIAKKYYGKGGRTEWKKIVAANPGVNPDNLKIGQKLVIPDVAGDAAKAPTTTPEAPVAAAADTTEYTVAKGDTPMVIAKRELGASAKPKDIHAFAKEIVSLNPGITPNALRIGQKLKLPAKGRGAAAPAPSVPAAPALPAPQPFAPVTPAAPNGFGAPTTPTAPNAGFGAPAGPSAAAFGAPTAPAFGTPAAPAFGAPATTAPAFGAPAQGGNGSDFASPYSTQDFSAPVAPATPAPAAIR